MFLRLVTVLAAVALLAGCSGEEGLRAQQLLQEAEAAQAQLRSSTFDGSMSVSADGMQFSLGFEGATSKAGEWVSLRAKGVPGGGDMAMQVLHQGGRVWLNLGDGWKSAPAAARAGSSATMSAQAFQQLARHVKDVRVSEHQVVGRKTVTTIAGAIDTQGLVEAATELGELAPQGFDLADAGVELGDINAVLTIDEATRLLDSAFITFSVGAKGKTAKVELRYRLASANEPVVLPVP